MIYQCINCKCKWATNGDDVNIETKEISHGLCKECLSIRLLHIYRTKQLKEGNFDCYGKSNGYCDQKKCLYRELCMNASFILKKSKEKEKHCELCA